MNVADQEDDPASLLHLARALIRLWREHPEIASPRVERLGADRAVVAFRYDGIAVAHDLAAGPRPAPEALTGGELLLGDELDDDGMLPEYGFPWVRMG